jgi:ParB-like chromosome segregation protein Spo0J
VRFLAKNKPPRFQIISGERRYQAATRAGLKTIPVVIRDLDDTLKSIHQLVENLQREDLNPIEEARAFQRYLAATNKTQAQLAQEIGKSKGYVSRILTLLERLTMAEQEELAKVSPAKLPGKSLIYEASGIKDPKTRLSILRGELTREQGREKVSTFKKKPLGGRPRSVRQQFTQLPNNPVKITASYPKGTTLDQVLEALIQARKEIDD